jgi:hypothetical protein
MKLLHIVWGGCEAGEIESHSCVVTLCSLVDTNIMDGHPASLFRVEETNQWSPWLHSTTWKSNVILSSHLLLADSFQIFSFSFAYCPILLWTFNFPHMCYLLCQFMLDVIKRIIFVTFHTSCCSSLCIFYTPLLLNSALYGSNKFLGTHPCKLTGIIILLWSLMFTHCDSNAVDSRPNSSCHTSSSFCV